MKLVVLLLFFPATVFAQSEFLSALRATQVSSTVRIDLTIAAGASYCLGIDLERSTDSLNFEKIAFLPGVCGGSEFEESYTMVDSFPLPYRRLYYRLEMGLVGRSPVMSILYVPLDQGIQCFPNPSSGAVNVHIDNPANLESSLRVTDMRGSLVYTTEASLRTFTFSVDGWPPGLYMIDVQSGPRSWRTRLVVP